MFQAKFKSQAQHFTITSSNIPSNNDKAVNVNQLVSHVPDYHNKSSLNDSYTILKNQMYKNVKKCIRMYKNV